MFECRSTHLGTALLLAMMLAGCGEPPVPLPWAETLAEVVPSTPKAEVLQLLPPGRRAPGERVVHGYGADRYFTDGSWIEVLWLEPPGGSPGDADPRITLNPVIFRDEALDGWGWDHFDRRAAAWGIRAPELEELTRPSERSEGGTAV